MVKPKVGSKKSTNALFLHLSRFFKSPSVLSSVKMAQPSDFLSLFEKQLVGEFD